MSKQKTAQVANDDLRSGTKPYQEVARKVLPYLVRQAEANQPIYYSDLAEQVGMPNPRNLNFPLGCIGRGLIRLKKEHKLNASIPPIQCLVVNKQNGLPGEGIGDFLSTNYTKLTGSQKRLMVDRHLSEIYNYQHWDWVLDELGIQPVSNNIAKQLDQAKNYSSTGESEQHRLFKEYIARSPGALGLNLRLANGRTEYPLPSADRIDVVFEDKSLRIGVEVKSSLSNEADILRGLFQCVKYKHLIEAEQVVEGG
ncbi:hypothetical protein [Hymenobacter sediminicola]|uniref:Uncharacterized protein n=1 Tax=Hymenobacter sediminicola TaxID=2761579 RepID=A0A7G7W765_9BACT|nr:hypothetical protein [Hymenobacter sediminicola]QNH62208.1 hypothetical protein H4317_19060 [Hymenobacter sediminicola]